MNRRTHLMQLAGLAGAGLGFPLLARAQSFNMKLSATTQNDLGTDYLNAYKANIKNATAGKVEGTVYPASQLGTAQRTIEGVSMGTVEVALNASGMYEGLDARFAALAVPGLFDNIDQGVKMLADPEMHQRLAGIATDKGVEVLTVLIHSQCSIVSRKPIRTLADLRGLKIRVTGAAQGAQMRALGANSVFMSLGEVLPAFQNGTIDAVYAGMQIPSALKFYDVAKTQTLLPGTFICLVGLVSSTFMKSVGALAPVLRETALKTDAALAASGAHARIDEAKEIWEKNGGEFISLSGADSKTYLDTVIPVAAKELTPAAKQDYEAFLRMSTKYRA